MWKTSITIPKARGFGKYKACYKAVEPRSRPSTGLLEQADLQAALKGFQEVVKMETDKGEWGFKAMKQIVKLHFQMGNTDEMLAAYRYVFIVNMCAPHNKYPPHTHIHLPQSGRC